MFYVSFARAERRWILVDRVSVAIVLFNLENIVFCASKQSIGRLSEAFGELRDVIDNVISSHSNSQQFCSF